MSSLWITQSQSSANGNTKQVINCIWKHPDARTVYLTCNMLVRKRSLLMFLKHLGPKYMLIKPSIHNVFENLALTVPEILWRSNFSFPLVWWISKFIWKSKSKAGWGLSNSPTWASRCAPFCPVVCLWRRCFWIRKRRRRWAGWCSHVPVEKQKH